MQILLNFPVHSTVKAWVYVGKILIDIDASKLVFLVANRKQILCTFATANLLPIFWSHCQKIKQAKKENNANYLFIFAGWQQ